MGNVTFIIMEQRMTFLTLGVRDLKESIEFYELKFGKLLTIHCWKWTETKSHRLQRPRRIRSRTVV